MKKFFPVLLYLLLFWNSLSWGLSIGLPSQERNIPDNIVPIVEALQQKDYYKAAVLAEDVLKKEPKNRFALAYLAAAYAGIGLDQKIPAILKKYQEIAPLDTNVYLQVATTYLLKNSPQKALKILEKAKQVNPNSPQVLFLLARLYDQQGKILKAVSLLEQSLKQDPNNLEAQILLARILIKTDQYQRALIALEKALKIAPQNQELTILKARALAFSGRLEEAQKLMASLKENKNKLFWETKALIANLSGDLEGALKAYQEILRIDPDDLPALINLGLLHKRKRAWKEAANLFERALKRNPNIRQIYTQLIIIYTDYFSQPRRTQELINSALQKFKNVSDPHLFDAIGWYYYQQKEYNKACNFFSKVTKIQENALFLYHQGICLEKLGHKKEAQQKLEKALSYLPPTSPLAKKIRQHL